MATFFRNLKSLKRGWNEGATAVEAALILPVFFLLIFGIIEFGVALWQWNTMLLAVEQAGHYVMVNHSICGVTCAETQMLQVLTSASVCTTPSAGEICVSAICSSPSTCTPLSSSTTMTLTANYSFNFYGLTAPFTISSQGTVPLD